LLQVLSCEAITDTREIRTARKIRLLGEGELLYECVIKRYITPITVIHAHTCL